MLPHCNLKQSLCLCSKRSSLFSFYALPSGGKSKDAVVHYHIIWVRETFLIRLSSKICTLGYEYEFNISVKLGQMLVNLIMHDHIRVFFFATLNIGTSGQCDRWLHYLFNLWPFTTMKIYTIASKVVKVYSKFCLKLNQPSKNEWSVGTLVVDLLVNFHLSLPILK